MATPRLPRTGRFTTLLLATAWFVACADHDGALDPRGSRGGSGGRSAGGHAETGGGSGASGTLAGGTTGGFETETPAGGAGGASSGTPADTAGASAGEGAATAVAMGGSHHAGGNGSADSAGVINAGGFGTGGNTVSESLPCDVSEILWRSCSACHQNPTANGAPFPLTSYAEVVMRAWSIRTQVLEDRMPFGGPPLPRSEKDILIGWIDAGVPPGPNPPIDCE